MPAEHSRRLTIIAALLVSVGLIPALGSGVVSDGDSDVENEVEEHDEDLAENLSEISTLLEPPDGIDQAIPANPEDALVQNTQTLYRALDMNMSTEEVGIEDEIRSANLPDDIAGRLSNVVRDSVGCLETTNDHWDRIWEEEVPEEPNRTELLEIFRLGEGLERSNYADILSCSKELYISTVELQLSITDDLIDECGSGSLQIWPLLTFDGDCESSVYVFDYMIQVDLGGEDKYFNNAGGNMIDTNFAPAGSPLTELPRVEAHNSSLGCQHAIPGLVPRGVPLPTMNPPEGQGECRPMVATLIDTTGDDTYGQKEDPLVGRECTDDQVHRRLMSIGAGFLGPGFVVDAEGDDNYTGKTGTIGAGHIFGVGEVLDRGGDDDYQAIRNSVGFSLIDFAGILRDEGQGTDEIEFYMPGTVDDSQWGDLDVIEDASRLPPISSGLDDEGIGGVVDDQGFCDNRLRMTEGAANLGGFGVVAMGGGDDTVTGGFSNDFDAPQQGAECPENLGDPGSLQCQAGGSIGYGQAGGSGVYVDFDGDDSYSIVTQCCNFTQGDPARGDDTVIVPGENSTGGPDRPDSNTPGIGLFADSDDSLTL